MAGDPSIFRTPSEPPGKPRIFAGEVEGAPPPSLTWDQIQGTWDEIQGKFDEAGNLP